MAPQIVKDHPAETAGPLAMALALFIGQLLNWDGTTVGAFALVLSFVPAVVTWIVNLRRERSGSTASSEVVLKEASDVGDRGQDPRRSESGSTGEEAPGGG